MATIVAYTDQEPPTNLYPKRIVSPVRAGSCCFKDMEAVGTPEHDRRWVFQYRRCRTCGFSVRLILHELPDTVLVAELRVLLENSFVRNIRELG